MSAEQGPTRPAPPAGQGPRPEQGAKGGRTGSPEGVVAPQSGAPGGPALTDQLQAIIQQLQRGSDSGGGAKADWSDPELPPALQPLTDRLQRMADQLQDTADQFERSVQQFQD